MRARGRPEERSVTLEYLKQLHDAHEKWLMTDDERFNNIPVVVLDADTNLEGMVKQYKKYEMVILGECLLVWMKMLRVFFLGKETSLLERWKKSVKKILRMDV